MNDNKNEGKSQTLEEYHRDLEELDIMLGRPHDLYFYTKPDHTIGISFNGGLMPNKEMLKAYKQLIDWLLSYDEKVIDLFNESVREDWERQSRESERKGSIKKKPEPISGFVYLFKSDGYYKIGKAKNLKDRLVRYESENPHQIEVVHKKLVNDYTKSEKKLLKKFADFNVRGEWFKFTKEQVAEVISEINKM